MWFDSGDGTPTGIAKDKIVPVPTAETRNTWRLQRVSTAPLDRTEESVKVPMDTSEKVDGVLGKHHRGVEKGHPASNTASSESETREKPQTSSNAVSVRTRRRMWQFLAAHGGLSPGQNCFGVEGRAAQVSRTLQTESARDHRMGHGHWKAPRRGRRGGRRSSWVNERNIFCGSARTRGRKAHGGSDVGNTRVLENGTQDDAQSKERSTWLATLVPSVAGVGGFDVSTYAAGSQAHGNRVTLRVSDVLETGKS